MAIRPPLANEEVVATALTWAGSSPNMKAVRSMSDVSKSSSLNQLSQPPLQKLSALPAPHFKMMSQPPSFILWLRLSRATSTGSVREDDHASR